MALPIYTPEHRRFIAGKLDIDEQYLYQIAKGIKVASPSLARSWHEIDPQARLCDLRPADWQAIWPELVTTTKKARQRIKNVLPAITTTT